MRLPLIALTTLMFSSPAVYGQTATHTLYFSATLQNGQTAEGSFGIPSSVGSVLGFFPESNAEFTISGDPNPIVSTAFGTGDLHGAGLIQIEADGSTGDNEFDLFSNDAIFLPLTSDIPICSLTYACAIFPDTRVFSTFIDGQGQSSDIVSGSFSPTATTPEPSSIALLGTGMLGIAGVMRKRFA